MKKVVFLGLGYIGLPTAAVAAAHGFEVIGVDVNPSVVETINQGKIHIVEPELGQVVRDVVQSGKLRAVCKPEAADAFFIASGRVPKTSNIFFICFIYRVYITSSQLNYIFIVSHRRSPVLSFLPPWAMQGRHRGEPARR